MGDSRVKDKAPESREAESLRASEKFAADAQKNGATGIASDQLADFNVTRQKFGDSNDSTTMTNYPNGVKFARIEGEGLKPGTSYSMDPPPGGRVDADKGVAYDANGKIVARLDKKDMTLHVYTKRGEFIESKDGKVTFKPSGATTDLQSLHRSGDVPKAKFEDYGMSNHGSVTRFPNGIEFNRAENKFRIPPEHAQNFRTDKEFDAQGRVTKVTAFGGDGKVLYTQDAKGIHVPTADGILTQGTDGKVKFVSNRPASASLPDLDVGGGKPGLKRRQDPMDILEQCKDNPDPLCGLTNDELNADLRAVEEADRKRAQKKK